MLFGFLIPEELIIPVKGADQNSYNKKSFWHYPWGKSGVHKGVDIFAKEGTEVVSGTNGIVLFSGKIEVGGNIIIILGSKWRLHYFAHLKEINSKRFEIVFRNKRIGSVGTTGNASGKPPHLHYSIITFVPYPWRIDLSIQGWKKMFFLNPIEILEKIDG
jgi:murein DD-endopeptidase MepM/ murein hydrolase activator NlpD